MIEVMLNNDQLKWSMRHGHIPPYFKGHLYLLFKINIKRFFFFFFKEAELRFKPTYKFYKGADVYDTSKKQRIPGWTDRILYAEGGLQCLNYNCVQDIRTSDHRPVFADFVVDIDISGIPHPQFDEETGNHGHNILFTSDSQVCNIM